MKAILTLFSLMCILQLNAQIVSIPDFSFKAVLVNNPLINTNGDGEIQVSEAAAFSDSIICFNGGITDITGIEAFTNLSFLNVALNNINSVDLSQNTQLKAFICPFNNLSTIDVSGNLLLEELVFWENNLTSIDVTMLPELRRLEFNSNSLTSLDITQNPLLERLFASGNMIGNLDFSIYPNLAELELNGCGMTTVDVSNNPQLIKLEMMINDVTSLDFSQNLLLEFMRCDFNEMVTLDLSMCPNLTTVGCFACDNLEELNVQNGNNTSMVNFQADNSANLTCIQVDDVAYSTANWTSVDNSNSFSISCSLASLSSEELETVKCYPNPVSDYVKLEAMKPITEVKVYNGLGQLVLHEEPNAMYTSLNVQDLSDGTYFMTISLGNDEKVMRRIVK